MTATRPDTPFPVVRPQIRSAKCGGGGGGGGVASSREFDYNNITLDRKMAKSLNGTVNLRIIAILHEISDHDKKKKKKKKPDP